MLLSNLTGEALELTLEGVDLTHARFYALDQERLLSWAPHAKVLKPNDVYLIEW